MYRAAAFIDWLRPSVLDWETPCIPDMEWVLEFIEVFRRPGISVEVIRGKTPRRDGMYREDVLQSSGKFKRVRRCVLLGPVSSISERAAWQAFQPYLDRVNTAAKMPPKSGMPLETFVKEWHTNVAVNLKSSTARSGVTSAGAHSAQAWKFHVDRDQHEGCANLRRASRNGWTIKKDGGKRVAYSVFNPSQSKGMGLRLREFFARRHNPAPRGSEERAAVLY